MLSVVMRFDSDRVGWSRSRWQKFNQELGGIFDCKKGISWEMQRGIRAKRHVSETCRVTFKFTIVTELDKIYLSAKNIFPREKNEAVSAVFL